MKILDQIIDGVKVRDTDLTKFRTETALRDWAKMVLRTSFEGEIYTDGNYDDRVIASGDLKDLIQPMVIAMRLDSGDRMMSMPDRNLDLVVRPSNDGRYMMAGLAVKDIVIEAFDNPSQMTRYEFDAYATLGDDECERQGIETLYDMFGTDFAARFFRRKNFLIARMEVEKLYIERRKIAAAIDKLEEEIAAFVMVHPEDASG